MESVFDHHRPEVSPDDRPAVIGPLSARDQATAEALVVIGVGVAAALAFAIVGFTIIVMSVVMPAHWVTAFVLSGVFALLATAAGLVAAARGIGRRTTE